MASEAASPVPARPGRLHLAVDALALVAVWALLLTYFRPSLLLLDTMTAGGDTPSFHHPIEHLRDVLLPAGFPQGWDLGNFAGYAPYRSYFLPPSLLVIALSGVVPFNVAFKLVTVTGIFLLPLATLLSLRWLGCAFPIPAIGSAASLLLLFNQGNSMWGANIPSTLAGEFSFSLSFALAVLFIGLLYRGVQTDRHQASLAILLALSGLCHPVPFLTAAGSGLYFLLDTPRLGHHLAYLARVYVVAALLMAFWLVPLIAGLPYATSIHWAWQFQSWADVLPPILIAPALLALADAIRLALRRGPSGPGRYLLFSLLVTAAAFCLANRVGVPDIRFVPFAQLLLLLLALDLLFFLPALPAPALPGLTLVFATIGVAQTFAGYIPDWVRWNYEGIERKRGYPDLQKITAALAGRIDDPRVAYEHSPSYDVFGSMRIFESLPRLAHRATLEGVLLQTAATSPFVYYMQSLHSEQGTSVIPGYTYPETDPVRGTARLDLFDVRDFLAVSDKVKGALDGDSRWTRILTLDPYAIYRRTAPVGGYVRVAPYRPVLVETANWKTDFRRWFDKDDLLGVPLVAAFTVPPGERRYFPDASRSPIEVPKAPQSRTCAIEEKVTALEIDFTTSCPGVPHWISMAYDPHWQAEGAAGVFLASPAFMMVVPDGATVRLRFVRGLGDWAGLAGTLIGMGLCLAVWRRPLVAAPTLTPAAVIRARRVGRVAVVLAVILVAVSVTRTAGSQVFAWRGWRAFQAQDFARARVEYDRSLAFGHHHASSPDAMFYRATSLFRLEDWADAIGAYQDLVANAPDSVFAAEGAYQIGICEQRRGRPQVAAAAFRRTADEYEGSRWAALAGDRLRELAAAPPAVGPR